MMEHAIPNITSIMKDGLQIPLGAYCEYDNNDEHVMQIAYGMFI